MKKYNNIFLNIDKITDSLIKFRDPDEYSRITVYRLYLKPMTKGWFNLGWINQGSKKHYIKIHKLIPIKNNTILINFLNIPNE